MMDEREQAEENARVAREIAALWEEVERVYQRRTLSGLDRAEDASKP